MSGIAISDLVQRSRERDARLPFEIGAFVALETAEALLERPRLVSPETVRILPDGNVEVVARQPADDEEAARSVGAVLSRLLVAAGGGVPPVLLELVDRGPQSGRWSLEELRTELEACLVPLNRGAARRVLARLLREGERRPLSVRPPPPSDDVDADLDALLDGREPSVEALPTTQMPAVDKHGNPLLPFDEVAKKPGQRALSRRERDRAAGLDRRTPRVGVSVPPEAHREGFSTEATPMPEAPPASKSPPLGAQRPSRPAPSAPPSTGGMGALDAGILDREAGLGTDDLDRFEEPSSGGRSGLALVIGLLVVIGAALLGIFLLRPDLVDRLTGNAPVDEAPQGEPEVSVHRPQGGDLKVTGPEGSQILLFVGRGPTEAEYLPVGVAHELVAIGDGDVSRSVIPASAEWDSSGAVPRYELAMQVDEGEGPIAFGESRLDANAMGTPTGSLGTVRVVTNPPGAKVYLVIGFGEALVEDLPVGEAHELLVVAPGGEPRRVVVGPSDWVEGPDGKVAEIDLGG